MKYSKKFILTLMIFYFLTYIPFILGLMLKLDEREIGNIYAVMSILVGLLWFLGIEQHLGKLIKIYNKL